MNLHTVLPVSNPFNEPGSVDYLEHTVAPGRIPESADPLIASLVHEIRNPLSTINLAAEMLKSLVTDNYQKKYLDIILRGSGKINDIVTDFLHSSIPAAIELEKHSVHTLLDEILETAADRILLKNVVVNKEYSEPDHKIELNRPKIKVALTNIIMNAIESVSPGSGKMQLVTRITGDRYMIEIGDNGCGISKKDLKNIFRPYFTTKQAGLGIGLSTTHKILLEEKVELKVESVKGMGTRFFLLFDITG